MDNLTKKDIQELLDAKIDPLAVSMQNEFAVINDRLGSVENRLENVEDRLGSVENHLENVEDRLGSVESDVSWMKNNSGELFTKLDKFIALYDDQKQELTFLSGQLKRLEMRVDKIESEK